MEKLIRDRIPELAENHWDPIETRKAQWEELKLFLGAKLHEEFQELESASEPTNLCEEAADLIEAIEAYVAVSNISFANVLEMKAKKRADRGGFENGIIWIF